MTRLTRSFIILILSATLAFQGCAKQSDKKQDEKKAPAPAAADKKAEEPTAQDDPYEAAQKDAELDKTLEAITEQPATGTVDIESATDTAAVEEAATPDATDSPAPSASKDEIIQELFVFMKVDRQLDALREMFSQNSAQLFLQVLEQNLKEKNLYTEENAKALDQNMPQYMEKLVSNTAKLVDSNQIKKDILVPEFKAQFSTSDLQDMLEFFSSPAGQAYVEKFPTINQTLQKKLLEQQSEKAQAIIMEIADAAMADLKPAADAPPAPAPEE